MTFVTVFAGGIALQRAGPKSWIWYMVFCKWLNSATRDNYN
jgi:hypothetical protein